MSVDPSINGKRVSHSLDYLCWMRGLPKVITVDNGPEFTGKVLDNRAWKKGVMLDFRRPGKSVENAFIESFNRTVRNECLNDNGFLSLSHARKVIEKWRNDYNNIRPHFLLGGKNFPKVWCYRKWGKFRSTSNIVVPVLDIHKPMDSKHDSIERCWRFFKVKMRENGYDTLESHQNDFDRWLKFYNEQRPHSGYRNQGKKPLERIFKFTKLCEEL